MFTLDSLTVPIIAAPMAGGPSTPELVAAAAEAGGAGFLAAGYKTVAGIAKEIARVRGAMSPPFGVNLFVPAGPASQDENWARDVEAYRRALQPEADRYHCTIPEPDAADRDGWEEKIAVLLQDPVPIVSFTFGCPDRTIIEELQRVGSFVVVSVTNAPEAALATERGADALCVQGPKAGGHRAMHELAQSPGSTGLEILLREVRGVSDLSLIAAGGITRGEHVAAALEAGAKAVQVGTVLLRSPESGALTLHKDALASDRFADTMVTRAFSGRFARGLVNRFMRDYHGVAPAAYPEVNQLTRPLRAAAAAVGDPGGMALWAETGYRDARVAPAAEIITTLWQEALAGRPL